MTEADLYNGGCICGAIRKELATISDLSPLWAGQNTAGCKEITAGLLTAELAGEIEDAR